MHVMRCVGRRGEGEVKEIHGGGMCHNSTEENKRRFKQIKHMAKKAVSKAMRKKAEEALTE